MSCGTNVQAMFIYLRGCKECFEKVRGRHSCPVRGILTGSSCPKEECDSYANRCAPLVGTWQSVCTVTNVCYVSLAMPCVPRERREAWGWRMQGRKDVRDEISLGMWACLRISETWAPSSHLPKLHACVVPQPGLLLTCCPLAEFMWTCGEQVLNGHFLLSACHLCWDMKHTITSILHMTNIARWLAKIIVLINDYIGPLNHTDNYI